ncbi:MAG: LD-carboxypeptidase [Persicimonas sp.]
MPEPLIHPPALKPGDKVAVLSPSGPVTPTLLDGGLRTLASWGLEPWVHESTYDRGQKAGYLAGGDAVRLAALHDVFERPDVSAIIFSRGGYGAMRLLAELDLGALREHPKLLVGFSDITALHLYAAGVAGIATLHGPVIKSFGLHEDDPHTSLVQLCGALFGERSPAVDGLRTVRPGRARGPVLGGNLSIVASMLASAHCPELNGAILMLEDVGEEDYRLDRLFTTLRLSEKAHSPAGIVLGDFTGCGGAYVEDEAIDGFVADLAAEFGCPVVADFPCGHGSRNVAVPMGVEATLDADAGALIFDGDAVSDAKRGDS